MQRIDDVGAHNHLLDDGQDPRLVVIVPVRSHTEVNLLWEGVGLVRGRELEDAVDRDC